MILDIFDSSERSLNLWDDYKNEIGKKDVVIFFADNKISSGKITDNERKTLFKKKIYMKIISHMKLTVGYG